jgi:hypothetical protein
MKFKETILMMLCLLSVLNGFSQAALTENLRATNTLDRLSTFSGNNVPDMLYGIPFPPGKIIGDTYLSTEWKNSTVFLYDNKTIEGYPTRYDIATNELEFNAKNGVKVLDGNKVKNFVWIDGQTNQLSYFVNAREFKNSDNVPLIGFFEVLSDGMLPLLKRTKVLVKKADYNAVLNVGSHDDKILKSDDLYYAKDIHVLKVPSSSKKLTVLFGDKSADVKKFINDNSLSVGKEQDMAKIFEYYNALVKK